MTSIWGPMGWMTLHSMASLYSDNPSPSEKQLMTTWLDMFRDTITCPHCKEHFGDMLSAYKARFPLLLSSRKELLLFTFRAHNAVNRRLSKPLYHTLADCTRILNTNFAVTPAATFRSAYIVHIRRYWRTMRDASGIAMLKKIIEMAKIEQEYASPRGLGNFTELGEETVILPGNVLEKPGEEQPSPIRIMARNFTGGGGMVMTPGGLRFRR
jgi:hypothetical protein